jgi:hypothetical protein
MPDEEALGEISRLLDEAALHDEEHATRDVRRVGASAAE